MTASPDFSDYLDAIAVTYAQWWERYTLMDAVDREQVDREQVKRQTENCDFPFDFGLMVQAAKPEEEKAKGNLPENLREKPKEKPKEKPERLPVVEGMRKYAAEHVLLAGRPGSGKSTALLRLLLEEAGNGAVTGKIPVLVELRYWETGVIDRILTVLQQGNCLNMDAEMLKSWLRRGRLLLLMDGLNELPSEEARRNVATFRRDYLQTPMIFTTRELSVGGDLGIAKKLEMQPLTETQMQEFVRAYLPQNQAEQMLRQLKDRLRELGQTPLLLWMLCGLFQRLGTVPPNLGMVFRQFTQGYERSLKEDVSVTAESRRWWTLLLQRLAFAMMQGENPQEKPTELQVTIAHQTAENILTQYLTEEKFDKPRDFAKQWLEDLLKHHLIQINGDKIEFRHQLIQEYYAAEYLLRQLPKLSDAALQRQYLNYLKWTEPIALMLALVEDEAQAVRVVELAIGVDLKLGARLAGEVRAEFQAETVRLLSALEMPRWLKVELWGRTRSQVVVPMLLQAIEDENSSVRWRAAEALGEIGVESAISSLLKTIKDIDYNVCKSAAKALGKIGSKAALPALLRMFEHKDSSVRKSAAEALGKIGSKAALSALLQALGDDEHPSVRESAVAAIRKIGTEIALPALLQAIEDDDDDVRGSAVAALGKIGTETALPTLLQAIEDESFWVRLNAAEALGKIGSEAALPALLQATGDKDSSMRGIAAAALGEIGSEAAISTLSKAIEDHDDDVRFSAVEALGEIGSETAILTLSKAIEDHNDDVRFSAVEALGKIGSEAALSALLQAIEDESSSVRGKAAEALGKIGSEAALPVLLEAIEDDDDDVRLNVAEALGKIGSEAALPVLLEAIENEDHYVCERALKALGELGTEAAISVLLETIEDENDFGRFLHKKDSGVRPRRSNSDLWKSLARQTAAAILGEIGTEATLLILLLSGKNGYSDVRWNTVAALGKTKNDKAAPVLPTLLNLIPTNLGEDAFQAIASIQFHCQFYNYEIFQTAKAIALSDTQKRTILFLAASPSDRPRLRLDEEARIITEALQRSDYGDRFELEQHWAVRPEDLHRLLPQLNPHIVYFCCHGEEDGLALDNGNGKTQLVSTETIADYLSRFSTIECVVLNSCYSDKQAEAIVQHIPYVIGMSSDILDKAALKFAQGFYNALGANLSYEAAYDNGKDAIALDGIPQSQIPILKQKLKNC